MLVAHTGQLDPAVLEQARELVVQTFGADGDPLDDTDWEHALGGLHALRSDEHGLVAHAALVQRRLLHGGRALRAGYVEAVAVRPDAQRRGHGGAVLAPLEQIAARAYDVVALSATTAGAGLYAARGWQLWRGRLSSLTPRGTVEVPGDRHRLYVRPGAASLDLDGELTADWREGDVW